LHQAAGARQVIELHGSLDRVVCLSCTRRSARDRLDQRLRAADPDWAAPGAGPHADRGPGGAGDQAAPLEIVDCESCGGVLKPDVVFFGENVPRPRVEECYALTENARALLVLGSSLTVMSGFRFVRRAAKLATAIAIVNQGPTRGDALAGL